MPATKIRSKTRKARKKKKKGAARRTQRALRFTTHKGRSGLYIASVVGGPYDLVSGRTRTEAIREARAYVKKYYKRDAQGVLRVRD